MLGSMAMAQSSPAVQTPAQDQIPAVSAPAPSEPLPPLPKGTKTVMGGAISNVDPVRDVLTLKLPGGGSFRILYDERTQLYHNGKKVDVLELHPAEHASIETTLDGDNVFAVRIHILSQLPQGQTQGQVLSYDPRTSVLAVSTNLTQQTIKMHVPAGTPVVRVGQNATSSQGGVSDLVRGALVDVTFASGSNGTGVASHIDVLATPGASFVYSGSIASLDLHAGRMTILDPRDSQTYDVRFEPSMFPDSRQLHVGSHVKVTTVFDGSRYTASQITIE